MQKTICLLPGDGIGPEIVAEAVKVLRAVEKKFGHSFTMTEALLGGAAIDAVGVPLPDATVEACKAADAVFLGHGRPGLAGATAEQAEAVAP